MHITERFLAFTLLGAEWVLWLLIGLSIVSFAIMIERAYYFLTHNVDVDSLGVDLRRMLAKGAVADARSRVKGSDAAEMSVVAAGLDEVERGVDAVAEAMVGRKAHERMRLERNLAFLGTLGNNAPFIGLFGTVLGIIRAFHELSGNQAGGVAVVMAGISEALVCTAVGLMVAIPAVIGFNYFNRRVRQTLANVDSLAHVVLAQLKGEGDAPASAKLEAK
ncbi:MAG TPA: MotA/TolQ/ExbB proton channel family protein [Polyangia bacterium]|nr:MotA/TolQ/ExbB proton channel family protein [Polyangia bacterium]